MIVISFPSKYEDRVSLMFREHKRNNPSFQYDQVEPPHGMNERSAYWKIEIRHNRLINSVLSLLRDAKEILGVEEFEFSYAHNDKELYSQCESHTMRAIQWFKI